MTAEPTESTEPTEPLPTGLPRLGRGSHRDPAGGACLMEAVALLAGEPQTDRPASVHPALAALARVVNDSVSDAARQALLILAPTMIGTDAADRDLTRALVALCCGTALPVALPIWAPRLHRDLRRAAAGKSFTSRQARRAVTLAAGSLALATAGDDRDTILVGLLSEAVGVAATSATGRGLLVPAEPGGLSPGPAVRG